MTLSVKISRRGSGSCSCVTGSGLGSRSTLVKGSFTFVRVSGIRCGQTRSKEVRDGQLQCGSGAGFTKFLAFYFKFSSHLYRVFFIGMGRSDHFFSPTLTC
ncbi:hypothetical protein HanXRQr2_Chr17g0815481 [Helianthus annuus]|uniref:Uncharacterized protein n=1 Tax=Helianthus annuus TaxID=4232 RepID=A0A9K3GV23_HELAN|nr:hypothetical protein HanXRQr2_Chr17g0815481 [Helianthus annuus]KAJ0814231.1 hypothetical protein HanPSC8_Chr17g0783181 [Helianthus annuus]